MVPCSELNKMETAYRFNKEYENTEFYKKYGMDFGFCVHANESESYVKGGGTDSLVDMLSLGISVLVADGVWAYGRGGKCRADTLGPS